MTSASLLGLAFTLLGTIIAFFALVLTYVYDRGRRYNYLADRWNAVMALNIDVPDFFDAASTTEYGKFDPTSAVKYRQHARRYWGFVEDVIRNNYWFERYLECIGIATFLSAYDDTIRECVLLHHRWLDDNQRLLFTYAKFRQVLTNRFAEDLDRAGLVLVGSITRTTPTAV
ncbi:MAG TPA: hypothetical protein VNV38_11015 [Stellaceae bacterium]|jgi:hypothetical protein|nr:hypothetical protein [Stellaceae bacterium]